MDYVDKQALRELLSFSRRLTSRVNMPTRSEVNGWLRAIVARAELPAVRAFRNEIKGDLPWAAIRPVDRGPFITAPPILLLLLSLKAASIPMNEATPELLDILERWDTRELARILEE
ncbi:MAG: hypothetical protein ACPG4T_21715 [Nannocystaceae bacterium]